MYLYKRRTKNFGGAGIIFGIWTCSRVFGARASDETRLYEKKKKKTPRNEGWPQCYQLFIFQTLSVRVSPPHSNFCTVSIYEWRIQTYWKKHDLFPKTTTFSRKPRDAEWRLVGQTYSQSIPGDSVLGWFRLRFFSHIACKDRSVLYAGKHTNRNRSRCCGISGGNSKPCST